MPERAVVTSPEPLQRFTRWPFFVHPFPAAALLNEPGDLGNTLTIPAPRADENRKEP